MRQIERQCFFSDECALIVSLATRLFLQLPCCVRSSLTVCCVFTRALQTYTREKRRKREKDERVNKLENKKQRASKKQRQEEQKKVEDNVGIRFRFCCLSHGESACEHLTFLEPVLSYILGLRCQLCLHIQQCICR